MSGYRDPDAPQSPFADLFDKVGPAKFIAIVLAGIAYMIAYVWLKAKLDWPDSYGFECRGKGCLIDDVWHSPALLHHHNPYEFGLFVCIWIPPALLLAFLAYTAARKLRGTKLSLYSDSVE